MIPQIKSELRKLLSVRSTYIVSILAIALVMFFSWILVWDVSAALKAETNEVATNISEAPPETPVENTEMKPEDIAQIEADHQEWLTTRQREVAMNSFSTAATFIAIILILQIIHEYRYNTIAYTLTSSKNRSRVFLSKTVVLTGFAVLMSILALVASLAVYRISYDYYNLSLPAQNLELADVILRGSLYTIAFTAFAAIIAWISRNIALAIAAFLIIPSMVEQLLSIWLKDDAVYLPFSAVSQIVLYNPQAKGSLDLQHALIATGAYLVVLYPLTWYLFLKRDAN